MCWRAFLCSVIPCLLSSIDPGRGVLAREEMPSKPIADQLEFFERTIRPALVEHCQNCHGAEKQRGGLRVDSREALLEGGDNGPAIVPGHADESLFIRAIQHRSNEDLKMPPKGRMPAPILAALTSWIDQGAPWSDEIKQPRPLQNTTSDPADSKPASRSLFSEEQKKFWAFQPPVEPPLPAVQTKKWIQSPIDQFLLARLEAKGLAPARSADRRTLIRRATYDLIGVPPTPVEVTEFLADTQPGAFARVVDRLLADPRYGERWGRHWLDLARYADSNGMDENVAMSLAYRYRDYVISAFNSDLPFNEFVQEQIAGDLLAAKNGSPRRVERTVATGFLSIGPKMLAEDDPVKMEMDIIDEQVDTIGRTFMGMTIGCARCHDHKFDPIPTADYYSLAGIFKSTKTMANHKVVAMWNERPIANDQELARSNVLKAKASSIGTKIKELKTSARAELLVESRRVADYLLAADANLERDEILSKLVTNPLSESSEGIRVIVEAENFARGNAAKDSKTYGQGIGIILNGGTLPNRVEYDLNIPETGAYQLEIRFAALEARPVKIHLGGVLVHKRALNLTTGSWNPDGQQWAVIGVEYLQAGQTTLVIECQGAFPHIDKIGLVLRPLPLPLNAMIFDQSKETQKSSRPLNPGLISLWSQAIQKSRGTHDSVFSAWHELNGNSSGFTSFVGPETPWYAELMAEPQPTTKLELATRYEALFHRISAKKPENGPLQAFVDDPDGPLTLPRNLSSLYPTELVTQLNALDTEKKRLEVDAENFPKAIAVEEQNPTDLKVHIRGSHLTLGEVAPRRFLRIIDGELSAPLVVQASGREELARWMTKPDHPLTSRVMVNRLWRWHFGEGLVRSTENFGRLGEQPDQPELLDWLARRFVEDRWSIKAMHRRIMASSAYQMSTDLNTQAAQIDPDNRLLWRMNRRRLEAETIRDSMLSVAGSLDPMMGGTVLETKNHAYVSSTASERGEGRYSKPIRSVYLPVIRSGVYDVFQAFDFADPSGPNGSRATTTVAPQALFLLNDRLILDASKALANRLFVGGSEVQTDSDRVNHAYKLTYSRTASQDEIDRALQFIDRYTIAIGSRDVDQSSRRRAWEGLCHALLASSEFLTID